MYRHPHIQISQSVKTEVYWIAQSIFRDNGIEDDFCLHPSSTDTCLYFGHQNRLVWNIRKGFFADPGRGSIGFMNYTNKERIYEHICGQPLAA